MRLKNCTDISIFQVWNLKKLLNKINYYEYISNQKPSHSHFRSHKKNITGNGYGGDWCIELVCFTVSSAYRFLREDPSRNNKYGEAFSHSSLLTFSYYWDFKLTRTSMFLLVWWPNCLTQLCIDFSGKELKTASKSTRVKDSVHRSSVHKIKSR